MTSDKKTARKGLLPAPMQALLASLGARYHRALQVIDEALDSENFKEKTWAVDLILKRGKSAAADDELSIDAALLSSSASVDHVAEAMPEEDLSQLSESELLTRIRGYLKDWEPD